MYLVLLVDCCFLLSFHTCMVEASFEDMCRIFVIMYILLGPFKLVFPELYGILLFVMFVFSFTH